MSDLDAALESLLAERHLCVLATLRRNGRPQLSTVMYAYDPDERIARVSVTDGRAKTKNAARDPRATLHVTGETPWVWVAADGDVELTEVTGGDDAAADELVELYRAISGEHDDWAAYRRDMAEQRRQVLRLHVTHLYGQPG